MATAAGNLAKIEALSAQLDAAETNYNEAMDAIWMLLAALLVFFMHAGFSFLEAGCVRYTYKEAILGKNLIVVTVGFLCWYVLGYGLALGTTEDPGTFAGGANFFMSGMYEDKTLFRVFFFQGAFCATAGTIVSGAMAERTKLLGFSIYTIVVTSIIYPIVVYWGWSGSGWLNRPNADGDVVSAAGPGYMDFAGSGIVHMVGGVGALCGAIIVGPRANRWTSEDPNAFAPHSVPFCVLGTFFLWFGWYGFNPGSTLSMHDKDTATLAGLVAVNTTLCPCVAGLVVFVLRAVVCPPKKIDVGGFCNGILAGLVSITAGCGAVEPWETVIIGIIGGFVYQGASMLILKLKIDDVVDAFAVHGACGLWGVLALGFFGNPDEGMGGNGCFYGGNQLGTQIVAAIVITLWVAAFSILILLPLRLTGLLRIEHAGEPGEKAAMGESNGTKEDGAPLDGV